MSGEPSRRVVDVIAAVITDRRGRVLLARRSEGRDLAGLWEFPGGKQEPGETAEAALVRELHEELGIVASVGAPVIRVPQAYPDKRLRLDVRRVERWTGAPRGREGQALAWVPLDKLPRYAMPPADVPVVAALLQPDRYLVTPLPGGLGLDRQAGSDALQHARSVTTRTDPSIRANAGMDAEASAGVGADPDAAWCASLDAALDAGVLCIQLRLPGLPPKRRETLARHAAAACRTRGASLLVNSDVDLARALGAGVHLPAAQLMAYTSLPLPDGTLVAASCHDEDELRHAQAIGCDFVVLGPVAATASHPGVPGLGWERFAALRELVSLPIYAIGGMVPDDMGTARDHGAQGIAAITGLWPPSG